MDITQAGWLEFNAGGLGHREQIPNARLPRGDPFVFFGGEQHVGWSSALHNEDWSPLGRSLRLARVQVELSAANLCNGHAVVPYPYQGRGFLAKAKELFQILL